MKRVVLILTILTSNPCLVILISESHQSTSPEAGAEIHSKATFEQYDATNDTNP
jgi:hypothetical protein